MAAPLGAVWGHGIYQSDADFGLLDLIASEAADMMSDPECLRCPLMPEYFTLRAPIDKPSTVKQLNAGIFHRLVRRLNHQKNGMAIIVLAAVGMELGVKIKNEDMLLIKMMLMKTEMFQEKKDQMAEAIEDYRNDGTGWRFKTKCFKQLEEEARKMKKMRESMSISEKERVIAGE